MNKVSRNFFGRSNKTLFIRVPLFCANCCKLRQSVLFTFIRLYPGEDLFRYRDKKKTKERYLKLASVYPLVDAISKLSCRSMSTAFF
jgi:hypothetical protein